jgi:hypothetical protein
MIAPCVTFLLGLAISSTQGRGENPTEGLLAEAQSAP